MDRRDEFFAKHPADGVRIPLSFAPSGQPIKKIALLQGTFKLRTGGTRQTVIDAPFKFENLTVPPPSEVRNETRGAAGTGF